VSQTALLVASLSARAFDLAASGAIGTALSQACTQAGTIAVKTTDADSSGSLSAGDHISATLTNCEDNGVTVSGTLDVTAIAIASLAPQRNVTLSAKVAGLAFTSPLPTQTLSTTATGTVQCQCSSSSLAEHLVVSGTDLAFGDPEGDLVLQNYIVDYSTEYEQYTQQLIISGRVEQKEDNTYFDFSTDAPLYGRIGLPAVAGAVTFRGGGSTAIRVEEGLEPDVTDTTLRADLDGDGVYESYFPVSWYTLERIGLFQPLRPVSIPDGLPEPNEVFARTIQLSADPSVTGVADMAVDTVRDRLYASLPDRNEIVVLSTSTYLVIDRIPVGSKPNHIWLSGDGHTLYAALSRGGAVAALDLASRAVTRLETAAMNGSGYIDNVIESSGRVFSTAWPVQSSLTDLPSAYLVKTDRNNHDTMEREAESQIFRLPVALAVAGAGDFLYIAQSISDGNWLLKLDLSQPGTPVVLKRQFSGDTSLAHLSLSPDGTALVLDSGEVLRTSDLGDAGSIIGGWGTVYTADGNWLIDATGGNYLDATQLLVYDAKTLIIHRPLSTHCIIDQDTHIAYVAAHDQFVVSRNGGLCVFQPSDRLDAPGQDGNSPPLPAEPSPIALPLAFSTTLPNEAFVAITADSARGYVYASGQLLDASGTTVVSSNFNVFGAANGVLLSQQPLSSPAAALRIVPNQDRSRFYMLDAIDNTGEIEVFDPASLSVLTPISYDISLLSTPATQDNTEAFDMAWIGNGQLLVSAVGSYPQTSYYLISIDASTGAAHRIAGGVAKFPPSARLLTTPDETAVILSDGSADATQHLARLNLGLPDPDIDLDRMSNELTGTWLIALSADGGTVYESGGVAADAVSLQLKGLIPGGFPLGARDGSAVFVLGWTDNSLRVADPNTFQTTAVYSIAACGQGRVQAAAIGATPRSVVFIKGGTLCGITVP
jgi:hypothetical protein